jgi:hypothetical protein
MRVVIVADDETAPIRAQRAIFCGSARRRIQLHPGAKRGKWWPADLLETM